MVIMIRIAYIIFLLSTLLIFSFKGNKEQLLVRAVIDNSTHIYRLDTNWLEKGFCIQIKIDTIYSSDLLFFKYRDKNFFDYNGKTYHKSQLFDIKQINDIKDLKIDQYETYYPNFEPPVCKGQGNCLLEEQKNYLKKLHRMTKEHYKLINVKIYPEITDYNKIRNKIILNYITLTIFGHVPDGTFKNDE